MQNSIEKNQDFLSHSRVKKLPLENKITFRAIGVGCLLSIRSFLSSIHQKLSPSSIVLSEMLVGYWTSQAIIAAAQLNIADSFDSEPREVKSLAKELNCNSESLYRLLRNLVSVGIFREITPGLFQLTKLGLPLKSNHSKSIRDICLLHGTRFHWQAWGDLQYSVKTGNPSLENQFGGSLFKYLQENPIDNVLFNKAMGSWTSQSNSVIAKNYPFYRFPKIVDVGGGNGTFLEAILDIHKKCIGIVFDQNHVEPLYNSGISFVAGSFFETVTSGADLYILKNILHDWNELDALKILKVCRREMGVKSRLLIIETIVPDNSAFHMSKMLDLEMLVMTKGGVERTISQLDDLIHLANFRIVKTYQFECLETVIEIEPIYSN